jgi:hypothetical protein
MATLQLKQLDTNGVTYSDPAKPDLTVRFKNTSSNKTLSGVNMKNHRLELIINDLNTITVGGVSISDPISARIHTSGAAESAARLAVLLHAVAAQIDTWVTENTLIGFKPSTAPVIPAAS